MAVVFELSGPFLKFHVGNVCISGKSSILWMTGTSILFMLFTWIRNSNPPTSRDRKGTYWMKKKESLYLILLIIPILVMPACGQIDRDSTSNPSTSRCRPTRIGSRTSAPLGLRLEAGTSSGSARSTERCVQ